MEFNDKRLHDVKDDFEMPQTFRGGDIDNNPRTNRRRRLRRSVLLIASVVLLWTHSSRGTFGGVWKQVRNTMTITEELFDWDKLVPSTTFNWVKCYDQFECARLEVPLDYSVPDGEKAAVAVTRLPSKYPVGHKSWKGPILYNPGGPGGSGVNFIQILGQAFSAVIGDDYDHVGFDPRGVGDTTPRLNVMPSAVERKLFEAGQAPQPINSTSDALARILAGSQIIGQLAESRGEKAALHMSTAVVARDMLSITRAFGKEKLLYWGFSYGTVLGTTYASMFPDNIERLIVDGVVDVENYYEGAWSNNLMDADKDLQMTFEACASSTKCALHEKSAKKVEERLNVIFAKLKSNPIPIVDGDSYGTVTWAHARGFEFQTLYNPARLAPLFFSIMASIEKGDGGLLWQLTSGNYSLFRCQCPDQKALLSAHLWETTAAIACGEGDPVDQGLEDLKQDYARMAELSDFADVWTIRAMCNGWTLRASEIYNGPFVGNTSFPLLFIGNIADPVTPLWAAKKMSQGFKDAVVLTQNSAGHCSLSAVSLCTVKHVRAYFREGKLPEHGTECDAEPIFPPENSNALLHDVSAMSEEEVSIWSATKELHENMEIPLLGNPMNVQRFRG